MHIQNRVQFLDQGLGKKAAEPATHKGKRGACLRADHQLQELSSAFFLKVTGSGASLELRCSAYIQKTNRPLSYGSWVGREKNNHGTMLAQMSKEELMGPEDLSLV